MSATVLIIDDDREQVESFKPVLEKEGYRVISAMNSAEGFDKVLYEKPNLIVMELALERHDSGFAFSKRLKADPLHADIPVIIVTGVTSTTGYKFSMEKDGYWMKADDYMDKPVAPEVLVERIGSLLARKTESV